MQYSGVDCAGAIADHDSAIAPTAPRQAIRWNFLALLQLRCVVPAKRANAAFPISESLMLTLLHVNATLYSGRYVLGIDSTSEPTLRIWFDAAFPYGIAFVHFMRRTKCEAAATRRF